MTIEAIAGMAQTGQADAARAAGAATREAEAAPPSEAADAFRETLGHIHDEVARFQAEGAGSPKASDPVEAAKAEMLPSPWKSAPAGEAAAGAAPAASGTAPAPAASAVESNAVLRSSFDHAIFVTLVSQVMGGISQTTSTLIRQQ